MCIKRKLRKRPCAMIVNNGAVQFVSQYLNDKFI